MTPKVGIVRAPRAWYRLTLLAPFIWQLGLAGLVNGVAWSPFGMPFQMAWQMAGVLVATAAIAFVFWRDEVRARRSLEREAAS